MKVSSWQAAGIRQRLKDLDLDTKGTKDVLLERLIAAIRKGKAILFDYDKLLDEEKNCMRFVCVLPFTCTHPN
jgi:hypothetical protein